MATPGSKGWSQEQIAQLRALWGTMTTAEIGRCIGLNKNQVVGKAHRLGLPLGENPCGKTGPRVRSRPRAAARAARIAPAASAVVAAAEPAVPSRESEENAARRLRERQLRFAEIAAQNRREAARRADAPPVHRNSTPLHYPAELPCQWPSGEAKQPGITFECVEPRVPDRPYCAGHCRRAYTTRAALQWERLAA